MVDTVSATNSYAALNSNSATKKKSETEATADRFLTMLVAQMQNQDPLNPLDNAQVTSQMAQLSTVQGIDKMNETMASMLAQMQGMQAANYAGREVLVAGNTMEIGEGAGARGAYELPSGADQVVIEIRNAANEVVASIPQGGKGNGLQTFGWDGKIDGKAVPPGRYTFNVAATQGGKQFAPDTFTVDGVAAVIPSASGARLAMASGATLTTDAIKAIL
jgi:flagellar basal-body rod modification protein FlgD